MLVCHSFIACYCMVMGVSNHTKHGYTGDASSTSIQHTEIDHWLNLIKQYTSKNLCTADKPIHIKASGVLSTQSTRFSYCSLYIFLLIKFTHYSYF